MASRNPRNEELISRFGKNVRKYRIAKGWTMIQLAVASEVELGAISTIERGVVNCSISTAYLISEALQIPIEMLFQKI